MKSLKDQFPLVEPDGAGKTILPRRMAALETPHAGHVFVDGADTRQQLHAIHAPLGYGPDVFGLYDALSVRRCLQACLAFRRVAR